MSARTVSVEDRARFLTAAYADYYTPMRVSADQMAAMDRFYDTDLDRSLVALEGHEVVGMALLSVRGHQGWVSGVGVAPTRRRRGIGRLLMERLLDNAAHAGLTAVRLEVIIENVAARQLYADLGFRETRELLIWRRSAEADALPIPAERLAKADPFELLAYADHWHGQPVTWQRAAATLAHMAAEGRLQGYRLDMAGALAAYGLVSGQSSATLTLLDIGIDPTGDIVTPGRILLQALSHLHWGKAMTISNVPADDPLNRVLAALRFLVTMRQVEMRLINEGL